MAKDQQFATGGNATESDNGNVPGTYRDPLSGARETALNEPQADAFVRLGWELQDKTDKVTNVPPAATLEQPNGSTSAEGREATDAAAAKKDTK